MEWKYKYGILIIYKVLGRKIFRNEMKFIIFGLIKFEF